jgi:ribosomal protein S8
MINTQSHVINAIKVGLAHKRKIICIRNLNKITIIFLYKANLINNIKRGGNFFYISINLNSKLKISNWCRSGSKLYLTRNQILKKKIHLHQTIYILSTTSGIINQHDAIKKNQGGFIIGKIFMG